MDGNNIVELTPSDIKSINNICISYWGEESLYQEDVLTNIISQNLSYGIKILGDLMAFCLMKRVGKQCTIFLIAVKPNYTKKGLGKAILSFCLDNAMNKGLNTFTLHVQDTNKVAVHLYEKFGFVKQKLIKNYYRGENYLESKNAYLMVLKY